MQTLRNFRGRRSPPPVTTNPSEFSSVQGTSPTDSSLPPPQTPTRVNSNPPNNLFSQFSSTLSSPMSPLNPFQSLPVTPPNPAVPDPAPALQPVPPPPAAATTGASITPTGRNITFQIQDAAAQENVAVQRNTLANEKAATQIEKLVQDQRMRKDLATAVDPEMDSAETNDVKEFLSGNIYLLPPEERDKERKFRLAIARLRYGEGKGTELRRIRKEEGDQRIREIQTINNRYVSENPRDSVLDLYRKVRNVD